MPEIRQARSLQFPDTDALKFLPEGPSAMGEGQFSWVGIQHAADSKVGSLNIYDFVSRQNRSFDLPGRPGFAFECQTADAFVVGCERSLGIFNIKDHSWKPFCDEVDADVTNTIINDGLVYEDNLIFGTKDLEFSTKKAGLYLYRGSDSKLIRLRDDQICSNGKAIIKSDDGTLTLFDIDSPTKKIVRYDLDIVSGTLGAPTTVVDFEGDGAVPDGMILTPDHTGIIVAMFHLGATEVGETRLYDRTSGELKCTWQTPGSSQNTCPALVSFEGEMKLVITTAVENFSPSDRETCPNAGEIFVGDTGIPDTGEEITPLFPY